MNKGKATAIKLRKEIGMEDPTDFSLEDVIVAHGGYLQFRPMGSVDGRIVYGKQISSIFINSEIKYEGRKRFALAHELGHLLMHKGIRVHDDKLDSEWFLSTSSNLKNGEQEWEANQFATEYLMPMDLFCYEANKSFGPELIHILADRFMTSLTSVAYRYLDSGLHPIAIFHIFEGKVKFWKKSSDLKVYIKNLTKLSPPDDSVAMEYIVENYEPIYKRAELKQSISKSTWFELNNSEEDTEFFEYCIVTKSYKNILSIIWEA